MMMQDPLESPAQYLQECSDLRFGTGMPNYPDDEHHHFDPRYLKDQEHFGMGETAARAAESLNLIPPHPPAFGYAYEEHHHSMQHHPLDYPQPTPMYFPMMERSMHPQMMEPQEEPEEFDEEWQGTRPSRRRVSKKKHSDAESESGSLAALPNETQDQKRKRFLERNRVAASKCRAKKKQWMQELEHKSSEIFQRNRDLQLLASQLKEEISSLKTRLAIYENNCSCQHPYHG